MLNIVTFNDIVFIHFVLQNGNILESLSIEFYYKSFLIFNFILIRKSLLTIWLPNCPLKLTRGNEFVIVIKNI